MFGPRSMNVSPQLVIKRSIKIITIQQYNRLKIVKLFPRNILTKFYPPRKELMSTTITRKLRDSLNVMRPSIKTRLLSTTLPIPRLKRPPPPVSDGTTTFTSTSNRLSKKKLWLQKLSTRLLLFMKSITPHRHTTGPKSCLPRQWTNSLAVMVHFGATEPTRLENLRVVQSLIAMIWRKRIRRRELVVDPKIGFTKGRSLYPDVSTCTRHSLCFLLSYQFEL